MEPREAIARELFDVAQGVMFGAAQAVGGRFSYISFEDCQRTNPNLITECFERADRILHLATKPMFGRILPVLPNDWKYLTATQESDDSIHTTFRGTSDIVNNQLVYSYVATGRGETLVESLDNAVEDHFRNRMQGREKINAS